jgi:integrase
MPLAHATASSIGLSRDPGSLEPCTPDTIDRDARLVITAYLSSLAPTTRDEYAAVMRRFALWRGVSTDEAFDLLLGRGAAVAHRHAWEYRAALEERGLSAASINLALSAMRSIVRAANDIGLCAYTLRVRALRRQPYRDTAGPGLTAIKRMIEAAGSSSRTKSVGRDRAILSVMGCLGLRRCEVSRLDYADVERDRRGLPLRLRIRGKGGSRDREWVVLPAFAAEALAVWLRTRGTEEGPLFVSQSSRYTDRLSRLSGSGVALIVRRLAAAAGLTGVRPHAIRHSVLTAALDANLGTNAVQAFARHRDPRAIMAYDDNRAGRADVVAHVISDLLAAS